VSEESVSVIIAKLDHISEELARHQEAIASLTESVMSIKLERAKERGYFLGALAVGSLAGGLIEKILKL
jgi:hypothetical protein